MKKDNKERLFEMMSKLDSSFKNKLNEGYGEDNLEEVKEKAKAISAEEGVVQHVNRVNNNIYKVSDWYDSDNTVCSFENGRELNEGNLNEAKDELRNEYTSPLLGKLFRHKEKLIEKINSVFGNEDKLLLNKIINQLYDDLRKNTNEYGVDVISYFQSNQINQNEGILAILKWLGYEIENGWVKKSLR